MTQARYPGIGNTLVQAYEAASDELVLIATTEFSHDIKAKAGRAGEWPVRTAASAAGFFGGKDGLYNQQDYAFFVEHAGRSPHQGVLARKWDNYTVGRTAVL